MDDDDEGETWRQLCEHRLFGDADMLDELMNQLWAHAAWLAWDGGGALLNEAQGGDGGEDDEDVHAMRPVGLSSRCVRAATKAAHDPSFGITGNSGAGEEIDNGVLKFLVTWTKQVALIGQKMQVSKRQHGTAIQSYARLVTKHRNASARLDQLNAAYLAMKNAEQALLEEELEIKANLVKLHH